MRWARTSAGSASAGTGLILVVQREPPVGAAVPRLEPDGEGFVLALLLALDEIGVALPDRGGDRDVLRARGIAIPGGDAVRRFAAGEAQFDGAVPGARCVLLARFDVHA